MNENDIRASLIDGLESIKNSFNEVEIEHLYGRMDKLVESIQKVLVKMKDKTSLKDLVECRLEMHTRSVLKEMNKVVLVAGPYRSYYLYLKTPTGYRLLEQLWARNEDEAFIAAEAEDKIRTDGFIGVDSVHFPTGQVVFTNYFPSKDDYAFDIPNELEYSQNFSINTNKGQENCMNYLAEQHSVGYAQLGNTSCAVYKKSDDELLVTSAYLYTYTGDAEIEVPVPDGYEYLGEIECGVWRIEFVDKLFLNASKKLDKDQFAEKDKAIAQVKPGIWRYKNYYPWRDDAKALKKGELPVWVSLKRNK